MSNAYIHENIQLIAYGWSILEEIAFYFVDTITKKTALAGEASEDEAVLFFYFSGNAKKWTFYSQPSTWYDSKQKM